MSDQGSGNVVYDFIKDAFKAGASYEHPISYNQAIEDVKKMIIKKYDRPNEWIECSTDDFFQELEKLKK